MVQIHYPQPVSGVECLPHPQEKSPAVRQSVPACETATPEFAHLAQLVEQLTCNQQVVSSILTMGPMYELFEGGHHHYLYVAWINMKRRCYDETHNRHQYYASQDIQVHDEWLNSCEAFVHWILQNLGERPTDHSLDRIRNDQGYIPGNLRWATSSEQNSNKRLAHGKSIDDRHIYFNKRDGKYVISINRKWIGSSKSLTEARKLRDKHA